LRTTRGLLGTFAVAAILVAACGGGATPTPSPTATPAATEAPTPEPTATPEPTPAPPSIALGCQVSDTGGIDDKGFNANAWKGMEDAQAAGFAKEVKFLESTAETDYARNINQFITEKCDIIVTVGFLLGDATKAAAEANPTAKFSIVDFSYDPTIPNVLGLTFQTDEAAMLAGYLAAGMSKSGKIGTFGGINIPPVTIFMDGLAAGVNYWNKEKGTSVTLLGWDAVKKDGSFTGDFSDKDKGKQLTQGFIQEGADIIVPVAGPVGLGAAAAVQDAKAQGVMLIGVDTDQYVSAPEYGDVTLTSILKRIDNAVKASVQAVADGSFAGGVYVGTLANDGVGLAPFHDFDAAVPADLKAALADLATKISSGAVKVADYLAP
jgi:basic membrane protein A and related proteins